MLSVVSPAVGPSSSSLVSERLMKMREVAALTNCHPNSIRRATEGVTPLLPCFRLPSGARRFRMKDVLAWLGQADGTAKNEQEKSSGLIPISAVIRVSTAKQGSASKKEGDDAKSSLELQEQRVAAYIRQRWGNRADVTWFKSIGSGLDFSRPAFLRMVEQILEGRFAGGFLVAQDFTRICRFGVKLIEHLCRIGNCQIIYTMDEAEAEAKGMAEQLSDEILSILTHYTAKASGAKSKLICEVRVSPETTKLVWQLYRQGYSIRHIVGTLRAEGRDKAENGRLITRAVVNRILRNHGGTLNTVFPTDGAHSPANSFAQFFQAVVKVTDQQTTSLSRKALIARYEGWCRQHGHRPMSDKSITKALRALFQKPNVLRTKLSATRSLLYVGLSLNS